jgi:hypothetical protein
MTTTNTDTPTTTPAARLEKALDSEDALLADLAKRGWKPSGNEDILPQHAVLRGATLLDSESVQDAPRVFFLWRETFKSERSVHGSKLRELQFQVNAYRDQLLADGFYAEAPALCVVGCPAFLVLFPIDGNPYTRRVRFTPSMLRHGSEALASQFARLNAKMLATWAEEPRPAEGNGSLLARLKSAGPKVPQYDWNKLYVGRGLDDEFVAFMGMTRRRIASILLDPAHRTELLLPILDALGIDESFEAGELAEDGYPTIESLAKLGRVRGRLIAAVDTVLLRLVLYRYLEAQFGYRPSESEEEEIALGSYDELLADTTRSDDLTFEKLLSKARKAYGLQDGKKGEPQLDLFNQAVRVTEPESFESGVRERNDFHGGTAGGDLHQGEVARAADVLQDYLLEHAREDLAALLEGTRSDRYSFHYADLDPRAFQRFYEDTIGTDIRVRYEPETGKISVGVEDWAKNQKEQGAFYTHEKMAGWLVERTLGHKIDDWRERLLEFLETEAKDPRGRLPRLRRLLDELLYVRIIDFACGGGIFLRAAFELMSKQRQRVVEALQNMLPEDVYRELVSTEPYDLFAASADTGHWEWHVLLNCLYGVDLDVKALNVASNLLTLSALTYKPHGVSFPSFINTNLKTGNAFVIPLTHEQRDKLPEVWGDEIRQLIALRAKLRDPGLARDTWRELHRKASHITRRVLNSQIVLVFGDLFDGLTDEALIERVRRVGCFLYELEFPEVFFTDDGEWRDDAGFDVVVGNPPWEEPAAEGKHFFPEFDPEYRQFKGAASEKREKELLADPMIHHRWKTFCDSVDDYRNLLTAGFYEHQIANVRGRKVSAHSNLYKYAVELGYKLLADHGAAGQVLDGGLWSDKSATGLRRLLIDQGQVDAVCGFTNNEGLFDDVHRSYKFACTSFRKPGPTKEIPCIFMRRDIEALDRFDDEKVKVDSDLVRGNPADTYALPELRSEAHWKSQVALEIHPRLNSKTWRVDTLSGDCNAGLQRDFFVDSHSSRLTPLIQGAQFNLWGVHSGAKPAQWVDLSPTAFGGFLRARQLKRIHGWIAKALERRGTKVPGASQQARALNWLEQVTGERQLPEDWFRLDLDGYRIAWREIARNDDQRSLIAAIMPQGVALTHKAPFVRPFQMELSDDAVRWKLQYSHGQLLYLTGCLSSLACDSLVRSRLAKTTVTATMFKNLHVPAWTGSKRQRRIGELCARLTCLPATDERPWADYTELAAAVDLAPERDGLIDPAERREAEVELNALAAEEYGLGKTEFRFLMDTLFMTPKYKETHSRLRDDISARIVEEDEDEQA